MIDVTPEALSIINARGGPIYLDLPPLIGCCIEFRDCPSVRFGVPHNPREYVQKTIRGIDMYIPRELPDIPLTITVSSFLGYKRLVVEGWKLA